MGQHVATNKRMKRETRSKHKLLVKRTKSLNLIENSKARLSIAEKEEKEQFDLRQACLHKQVDEIDNIRRDQFAQKEKLEQEKNEQLRLKEKEERNEWNEHRNEQKIHLNEYYQAKISKLEIKKNEEMKQKKFDKIKQREL